MDTLAIASDLFGQLIAGMSGRLQSSNLALTIAFFSIAAGLVAAGFAFESKDLVASSFKTLLATGLLLAVAQGIMPLSRLLMEAAIGLGLATTGGGGMSMNQLLTSPDQIYYAGLAHSEALYAMADEICGVLDWRCLGSGLPTLPIVIAAWVIWGVYVFAAVAWFVTLVLFKVIAALALVTIPFVLWGVTQPIGSGPLRVAAHAMAQMFALTVVISLCNMWGAGVVKNTTEPSIWASAGVIVLAVGVIVLVIGAGALAYMMMGGAIATVGNLASPVMNAISTSNIVSRWMGDRSGPAVGSFAETRPVRAVTHGMNVITGAARMPALVGSIGGATASMAMPRFSGFQYGSDGMARGAYVPSANRRPGMRSW